MLKNMDIFMMDLIENGKDVNEVLKMLFYYVFFIY